MRKFFISAALVTAAIGAVPAAAQYGDYRGQYDQRGPDRRAVFQLEREVQQIEQRIIRSQERGRISNREANSLMRDVGRIRTRLDRAAYRGANGRDFARIQQDIHQLRQRLRDERQDYDGRRY